MRGLRFPLANGRRGTGVRGVWRLVAAAVTGLVMAGLVAGSATGATRLPVLWEAGGLDAGSTGAGQAARITSDPVGNVAVVSGPAVFQDLAVTSYTPAGTLRWRSTVSPSIGVFIGDWVAAAANGDVLAVGHNVTSSGNPIGLTLVRFGSDGGLKWRVDLARTVPSVGRLLVDRAGNAYLVFDAAGNPRAIELDKYSPAGALLWSRVVSAGVAKSLALSPDEADVVVTGNGPAYAWVTAAYDTTTGNRRWLVTAAPNTTLGVGDVVVDAARVYVTGRGVTGRRHASAHALAHRHRLQPGNGSAVVAHGPEGCRRHRSRRLADRPGAGRESRGRRPSRAGVLGLVHGGTRDHGRGSVGSRARRGTEHQ